MTPESFFASVRAWNGHLTQSQVEGFNVVLWETRDEPSTHRAYMLATCWHETARTMQPIAEYGKGRGKPYGKPGKHGQAQYGRGYVQLTWDANYERADAALGLNGALLADFNLAMRPDIAAQIMVRGMTSGWFTSKKCSDYLSSSPPDYLNARRIINGTDKAALIAGYAKLFESALLA